MAILFDGSAYLRSPEAWGAESYAEFTTSFVLAFNGQTRPLGAQYPVFNYHYRFSLNNYSSGGVLDMICNQTDVEAGAWTQAEVQGFPQGVPVQVTLTYSATDPTRRFLDINGHRDHGDWATTLAGFVRLDQGWTIGTDGSGSSKVSIQNLLFINKAMTDEEIEGYRSDPEGTLAALTATVKRFYSFDGTVGTAVATGDAGISIDGDPDHSFIAVPAVGSTMQYVEPIQARRASVDQAYITTSGDALIISLVKPGSIDDLAVVDASHLAQMICPTISINGGPSIVLDGPDSPRTYHYGPHGAFFWLLPVGVGPLTNSDVVHINAPRDWVGSEVGGTDGMTNRVVDMRVGKPSSKPSDGLMKVGGQCTTYASSIWSGNKVMANVAKLIENRGDKWEDGTMKGAFGQRVFWYPGETYFDSYGWDPTPYYGKWLLMWEDYGNGYSPFVDMYVKSELPTVYVDQLDDYSSDVDGKHVRVLEVSKNVWNLTLAASIDASTTSIPLVAAPGYAWQGFPDAPYFIVLTIGTEKIKATGYDSSTMTFTGCQRGWDGTTAAAHANGNSLTAFHTNNTFGLWIWTDHDETHRYKNLQLYAPGNWDEPAEAGSVSYTPEDHYKIDKYFYDNFISQGMGPHRVMECAGGMFDDRSEMDDVATASAPMWNFNEKHQKLVFDHVVAFNPANRYFYFNGEASHLETYSATLVDAIDATTTTVRLTRTTSEPDSRIPYGQAVFIGSERMQVVGLPAVGDDHYTVWRGRMGTTAASHAAGSTATVGWRKAITDVSQYGPNPASNNGHYYKYAEILVDESLSLTPMRNGLFMQGGPNVNNADMMLTARRTFTLAAALSGTDLTMTITPADPGDWAWIKPYGYIWLDSSSEAMTVTAVDSSTGVITLESRRSDTPATGSIGDTGRFTAPGPLWSSEDDSIQYYQGLYNYGPPLMQTGAASAVYMITGALSLGADVPMRVKTTQYFNKDVAYKPRTDDHLQEYSPWNSIPYDFHAHMCLAARNAAGQGSGDAWICVSYGASDDMMYEIAKIYRDILPAGCKLYMEYGNEVWNFYINGLKTYANANAWATGIVDGAITAYYHFLRSCKMIEIGRACFAEVGRAPDFQGTIAWQIGGMTGISDSLIQLQSLGFTIPQVDAVADAPYTVIASTTAEAYKATFDLSTNEQAVDLMQFDFEFGPDYSEYQGTAKDARDAIEAHFGWRPAHVCYEGGPGNMAPAVPESYPNYMNVRQDDFLRTLDLISHPNFRHWMRSFYDVIRRRSDAEAISIFCFGRPPGQNNNYLFQLLWGIIWHDRHKAGRGDGTDGLNDNRLHLWQQGKPNSVNGDYESAGMYNVSPGLLAFQEYNNEYFGAPSLTSAVVSDSGGSILLTFDQSVAAAGGPAAFSVTVNLTSVAVVGLAQPAANVIVLNLGDVILSGQTVLVSGTTGSVVNVDGRPSTSFFTTAVNHSQQTPPDPGTGTGIGTIAPARRWPFGGSYSRAYRGFR
ncbi:hypothetical protein [Paludisphaera rhizosphaerae]|uniref:hypothetical protein n=1 Tax=Paludisphaera rhizosphaerae TaxID=2711216 RepID=UPI0013ED909E|nr:hypothetical protein [Paludisphaera rhizosphaerae]